MDLIERLIEKLIRFTSDASGQRVGDPQEADTAKKSHIIWTPEEEELAAQRRMIRNRITPRNIKTLDKNQLFVFGSSTSGAHDTGAARFAVEHFGAIPGIPWGPQGRCYAIPTDTCRIEEVKGYVDEFFAYVAMNPDCVFLVTKVGCGAAGHTPKQIAPLFKRACECKNVCLPEEFWRVINGKDNGF